MRKNQVASSRSNITTVIASRGDAPSGPTSLHDLRRPAVDLKWFDERIEIVFGNFGQFDLCPPAIDVRQKSACAASEWTDGDLHFLRIFFGGEGGDGELRQFRRSPNLSAR